MTHDLRVLLVGAGRAGLVHGRNFARGIRGAQLIAVADPNRGARGRAAGELGCIEIDVNAEAAVVDDSFDAVVIASPTFTHARIGVAALQAGKHVLCEKPLASSLEDAREIVYAANASHARFVMGFMRRFDRSFRRAAERIEKGEIGDPVLVRSTGRGPGLPPEWAWDPTRSGGLIAEVNSHDLDTLRWLSGKEFDSVYAVGAVAKRADIAERFPAFVDVVAAVFQLADGCLGQVDGACPADYGYDARAEVYGTAGVVMTGTQVSDSSVAITSEGVVSDSVRSWRDLFSDAYRAEDAHLVAVAKGDEAPVTGAIDGLRALEAAHAVNLSMRERRPVRLNEFDRE
jgi:predicted dehydrogenase